MNETNQTNEPLAKQIFDKYHQDSIITLQKHIYKDKNGKTQINCPNDEQRKYKNMGYSPEIRLVKKPKNAIFK